MIRIHIQAFCVASLFAFSLTQGLAQAESPAVTLIDKHGCKSCHLINGDGGRVGPPLDGIGKHCNESYIIYRLSVSKPLPRRKKLYPLPYELMSHVHVPHSEVTSIAKYLHSLPPRNYEVGGHAGSYPETTPGGAGFKPDKKSVSSERGMHLFKQKGCFACHSIDDFGGLSGPGLEGVGARRSRNFISDRVSRGALILPEPTGKSGQASMPAMKLSAGEIKDITNWLMTLPAKKAE